jgi:O-antigen/teichoic acid export membrane protein
MPTDAAGAVAAPGRLQQRALSLGAANAFDYGVQFLLPIVLVRCLDPEAFGEYRLLWLAAGTVMAVVTQSMASSLYYFLPRSTGARKRLYINQVLLFLAACGLIGAWAVSAWNPWLPVQMQVLARHGFIVPVFVMLWVVASLLDLLPTIEEKVAWQTRATIGLATLRAGALSLTAFLTHALEPVLAVLLGFVAFKVLVLLGYVVRYHGLGKPLLERSAFADQWRHAAPFGAAGALYGLRAQADQWVAAALFSVGMFAAFSIAAVLGPLVNLFRQSVIQAFLPGMSRLHAAGDIPGMLRLNGRANVLVAALAFPLLGYAFVYAEEIVSLVYTAAYTNAAPVMRVYIGGIAALTIELVTIMLLLRQGSYAMRVNAVVLPCSVGFSWWLASQFGLAGAAAGSVIAVYLDLAATLHRIARCTGIAVRRLQDWEALGRSALCALCAATLTWFIAGRQCDAAAPVSCLALGAMTMAATYGALHALFGPCLRNPDAWRDGNDGN